MPNGTYNITLNNDKNTYRCEKINGEWFWSDGTGWKLKMECPESITSCVDISTLPKIERNYNYGLVTWPLSEYFRRSDA